MAVRTNSVSASDASLAYQPFPRDQPMSTCSAYARVNIVLFIAMALMTNGYGHIVQNIALSLHFELGPSLYPSNIT